MSVRVHELARRIGIDIKELLTILKARGFDVKTVSSTVDRISADAIAHELMNRHVPPSPPIHTIPVHAPHGAAADDAEKIDELITHHEGTGAALEFQVHKILEQVLPHSFLANVPIFRPDAGVLPSGMATELDFVLHAQTITEDRIIIIECKSCPVEIEGARNRDSDAMSEWVCCYGPNRKPIKAQLRHQRRALLLNIEPLQRNRSLQVLAIVVCSHANAPTQPLQFEEPPDFRGLLLRSKEFRSLLESGLGGSNLKFLRVQQSEILRRLRLGQALLEIGHPEIPHAVEYAARARQFIDSELFLHLRPTAGLWAINGSAGMGKSMLLAYALLALVTDMKIGRLGGEVVQPQTFSDDWSKVGAPQIDKRRIWAVAQTDMQVEALRRSFDRYVGYLADVDQYNQHIRVTPQFKVLRDVRSLDYCNILLVDEAHDLTAVEQDLIANWFNTRRTESDPDRKRYLIVACDRHQKLRLVGPDARIIEGLSFTGRAVKLDRNYRNPFAVYAGSIALLFRWFAESGPKVIPSETDLRTGFSFNVAALPNTPAAEIHLTERNDAHPANNWSHVLSEFPSAQEAHQQLRNARLNIRDVLWLRFGPEDPSFNYQNLTLDFTYHPVRSDDASSTIDRYVKGQEYPIVVLEGLPSDFDFVDAGTGSNNLWQARRLFYLAASRATVFLFFVLPQDLAPGTRREFDALLGQLGHPPVSPIVNGQPHRQGPSGKFWEMRFHRTSESLSLRSYLDLTEANPGAGESNGVTASGTSTPDLQAIRPIEESVRAAEDGVIKRLTTVAKIEARQSIITTTQVPGTQNMDDKAPPSTIIPQIPLVKTTGRPELPTGGKSPNILAVSTAASSRPIPREVGAKPQVKSAANVTPLSRPLGKEMNARQVAPSKPKRPEPTVQELASHLGVKPHVVVRDAQAYGPHFMSNPNDKVDWAIVSRLCAAAGKPVPT